MPNLDWSVLNFTIMGQTVIIITAHNCVTTIS